MAHTTRVTLADVAKAAQVSASTASLAFSGHGPISAATRAKVLAAAEDLGYLGPDPIARSLRRGRSGIVGVVIGDQLMRSFRDPVTVGILDALVATLAELDLSPLLIPVYQQIGPESPHPSERTALDAAILMACTTADDPDLAALRRRGVPLIAIEGPDGDDIHVIRLADRVAVADLTTRLVAKGHERFAVVSLPLDDHRRFGPVSPARAERIAITPARTRLAGIRDAGVEPVRIIEAPASLIEHGVEAGRLLLGPDAPEPQPTAILAQSDLLAAGVVLAARELGLRMPDDVAVAGFDGVDLPWLAPDVLTTVVQPLEQKGIEAARAVGALLDGETLAEVELQATFFQGSTA